MARKPNGAAEPEVEIVVEEGAQPGAEINLGDPAAVAPAAAPAADVKEGAEALQAQLDAERRRADDAVAEADRLRSERVADRRVVVDSRLAVIDSTINTKKSAKDDAMRRKKEALEAGDYDAQIKIDDELSVLNLDLKQLNLGKSEIERQIEEGDATPPAANTPAAKAKDFYDGIQPGPSKDWVKKHYNILEEGRQDEIVAAHIKAMAKKIKVDSPQYFALIEEELGVTTQPQTQQREEPEVETETATAAPAAPVSRNNTLMTPTGKLPEGITRTPNGGFRLSLAAAEAARISGVTYKEYIENALALQAEGRLN